jgi:hypothetical protein
MKIANNISATRQNARLMTYCKLFMTVNIVSSQINQNIDRFLRKVRGKIG